MERISPFSPEAPTLGSQSQPVVLLLSGGKSRRMGRDKSWLEFGGQPLLLWMVQRLSPLGEVLVIKAPGQSLPPAPVKVYEDLYPNLGPVSGIYTGLYYAQRDVIAVSVDLPFVSLPLLQHLWHQLKGWDAVIPEYTGYGHPLCAVYSYSCLPILGELLSLTKTDQGPSLHRTLTHLKVRWIPPEEVEKIESNPTQAFFNINTPEDYETALTLFQRMTQCRKNF